MPFQLHRRVLGPKNPLYRASG